MHTEVNSQTNGAVKDPGPNGLSSVQTYRHIILELRYKLQYLRERHQNVISVIKYCFGLGLKKKIKMQDPNLMCCSKCDEYLYLL